MLARLAGAGMISVGLTGCVPYDTVVNGPLTCGGNGVALANTQYLVGGHRTYVLQDGRRSPAIFEGEESGFAIYRYGPEASPSRLAKVRPGGPNDRFFGLFFQLEAGTSDWIPCFDNDDGSVIPPQAQ